MKIKTKPWLTFGIIKSIKTKNKLFKLCYKQNKPNLVNKYKEYLKVLKQTIKKAKQSYYHEEIVKYKNNFQKQWGIINKILGRNKKNKCQIHEINDINNNQKLTEDYAICNNLNQFFTKIGINMDSKISAPSKNFRMMTKRNISSFYFNSITADEVLTEIHNLDVKKANGPEDIPIRLTKMIGTILALLLSKIYNASYDLRIFPTSLKRSKVVPVYKSGTKNIAGNYRPISILSPFSKIFEKLIYVRLEKFLVKNDILSPYQFGFRRNHSTSLASLNLLSNLQLNYDEGYNTCCIFLDLSKAFDIVNHQLLLQKLSMYGVRGNMFMLLKDYLTDRLQFTACNNTCSTCNQVLCGVPLVHFYLYCILMTFLTTLISM